MSQRMSDSEEHNSHGTEMRNVAEGPTKPKGCCTRHPYLCCSCLVFLLILMAIVGALLGAFFAVIQSEVNKAIGEHVKLVNGSAATDQFMQSSAPLYSKYYFFNVTNPHEILQGATPQVKEIGPFVYRENRTKFDPSWEDDDTVLSYSLAINYTFDKELSTAGDPKQIKITTINVPLMVIGMKIEEYEKSLSKREKELFDEFLKGLDWFKEHFFPSWEQIFTSRTVEELLFGYEDPLLAFINKHKPDLVSNPIFGFSNRSEVEAPNRVLTGVNDTRLVGQYVEWNNQTEIKGWGTPEARMINGTGGFLFHPGVTREENLTVFVDELYRSGFFVYVRDVIVDGIRLYEFELPSDELLNNTQDPGFFANGPSGVLNITAVAPSNAPLFISKPHFLHADPGYLENVTGLHPNPAIHDSHLDVEPITGAVLKAEKRIQLNFLLQQCKFLPEIEKIPNVMLPIFYGSEEGSISPELANDFKSAVYTVKYGVTGGIWAAIGLAGLVFIVSILCLMALVIQQCRSRPRRRYVGRQVLVNEYSPLISGQNEPDI